MPKLVWIINDKKKEVKDNPVKLVESGMIQSKCGHSNKLIDNDLIFNSKSDAEKYLDMMYSSDDLFQDPNFGSERIRHVYITFTDKDDLTHHSELYARINLTEDVTYPVGSYKQFVTLTLDNYNLQHRKFPKDISNVTISFFHKKKKEIINNLKYIKCNGNCLVFMKRKEINV